MPARATAWRRSRPIFPPRRGRARSATGCWASSPRPTPPARARCWRPTRPRSAGRRPSPRRCARPRAARPCRRCRATERARNGAAVRLDKGARGGARARRGADGAAAPTTARRRRGARAAPTRPAPDRDAPRGRSSRLGGAIIIGASVLLVAAVLVFVLTRGGDDPEPTAETTAPPAATATATRPAAGANDILLKGPAGSKAVGPDAALPGQRRDGALRDRRPGRRAQRGRARRTRCGSAGEDGKAQLLGDVKDPVGENGELTSAGPRQRRRRRVPAVVRRATTRSW